MQELLSKIINDKNKNGLYLVNAPTGSAKSYTSVQVIKDNLENTKVKRFIFMTNNLNNLPMDDLKKALGDKFDRNVIRLKNAIDNILDNLEPFIEKYDYKYNFSKWKTYEILKKCISRYNMCKQQKLSLEDVEKDLRISEMNFRRSINQFLNTKFKENKIKKKKEYVKTYYNELAELYPAIFLDDYKVICLSTNKFFLPIDIIYDKKIQLINSDLLKDSIIFIDEFDATKDVLNDMLINKACRDHVDYHVLANIVSDCFKDRQFIDYKSNIIFNAAKMIESETNQRIEESTDISRDFYLPFSMDCEDASERDFILSDLTYHEIFQNTDVSHSTLYFDESKKQLMIKFVKKGEQFQMENSYSIPIYLRKIHRYLMSVNVYLLKLAEEITNIQKHNAEEKDLDFDEKYERERNYASLLNDLRFPDYIKSYFNNITMQIGCPINVKRSLFKQKNSFYYRGIKLYEIKKDLDNNRFNASIFYHAINISPEFLLLNLAKLTKVIGLSATCNFRTVYGNYNLDFLSDELNGDFHLMDQEDFDRIKNNYNLLNEKYDNGEIKVHIEKVSYEFEIQNSIEDELEILISKVLDKQENRFKLKNILKSEGLLNKEDIYIISRYLTVAYVYRQFVKHKDMKSFLCLNNKLPKENDWKFDLNVLNIIFEMINKEYDENEIKVFVLKSGEEFSMKKSELLQSLRKGQKIFVISAYATLGAGQNLAYTIDNFNGLVNLVDFNNQEDGRNKKKDFDGIYLGKITNVLTVNTNDENLTLFEQLKFILDLENLYENYEISSHVKNKHIQNALMNHLYDVEESIKNSKSARLFKTKQYVQALGRLSRAFNKNPNIYVYIHNDVLNSFDDSILDTEILSPETRALALYVKESKGIMEVFENYKLKAEKKNNLCRGNLLEILSNPWTDESIHDYEKLGLFVLKHPTLSADELNNHPEFSKFYIRYNQPINHYYFQERNDFENTEIYFNKTKDEARKALESIIRQKQIPEYYNGIEFREASEDNTRLKQILHYPGMKEYFETNGFATSFENNDYIITPYIYQAIYKGRLGEMAAKYIIETIFNIQLEKLNNEEYEFFDFKYKDLYIDIKHWRYSEVSNEKMKEKIKQKMAKIDAKKAVYINLFDESNTAKISVDERIIQIPALLENDGSQVKKEAILELNKHFEEE